MRVGIIGCGLIAKLHVDSLSQTQNVALVAFCDVIAQRAEVMAEPFGGQIYTDFEAMLQQETLDAVHICTPHHLHLPMAEAAAAAGVAVFTEKPPVISWEQWERFQALRNQTRVGICFQNRYNPSSLLLEKIVHSPEAGKILGGKAIVTWVRDQSYYDSADWRGKLATEGGGALINQAIHTLDLLVRLTGRPDFIEATTANYHLKDVIEVEDTVSAFLGYDDGTSALFYATTAYVQNSSIQVEICCENVTVRLEDDRIQARWSSGKIETVQPEPLVVESTGGQDYWGQAHVVCIKDFYKSLRNQTPYQNDIDSVKAVVETTLGIYQSAREQSVITL